MKNLLAIVLLVSSLLGLSSCNCWSTAHQNDIGCVVVHDIIDCTGDASLAQIAPAVEAIVTTYIVNMSATPDWNGLITALEAAGIKDGGCIIAQIQAQFIDSKSMDPLRAAKAKAGLDAFKAYKIRHNLGSVKYKVLLHGKEVVL